MEKYPQNQATNPEKFDIKKASKKALYGLAIIAMLSPMVGCSDTAASSETGPSTTVEENIDNVDISKEIDEFTEKYGENYSDKETIIPTYYAEKALEKKDQEIFVISQQEIDAYTSTYEIGATSGFNAERQEGLYGFGLYQLPPEFDTANESTSIKVFNEYIAPMMSKALNYLAKNPNDAADAVAKNEFLKYCTTANFDQCNNPEMLTNQANSLMSTIESIAGQYGSNSNFEVVEATTNLSKEQNTRFNGTHRDDALGDSVESLGLKCYTDMPYLCIKVDTYDSSGEFTTEYIYSSDIWINVFVNEFDRYVLISQGN